MIGRRVARTGRPGLIGVAARTAVVAGTATAVTGRVANRQQQRAAAVAAPVAPLLGVNLTNNGGAPAWGLLPAPVAVLLLLGILRWSGGTWAEAGRARASLGRGVRWALALIGIVASVYLVGALLP